MHRLIALVTILAVPFAGYAQQTDLSSLDQNQDGFLSFSEASRESNLAAQFNALDVNRDGFLSPAEQAAVAPPATGAPTGSAAGTSAFSTLDQDGDGVLTPGEAALDPSLSSQFNGIDVNQDGLVSLNELRGFTTGAPGTVQPQSPGTRAQPPTATTPGAFGDGISGPPPTGFSGSPPTDFTGRTPGTPAPSPVTPAPNPVAPPAPGTITPGAGTGAGGATGQ